MPKKELEMVNETKIAINKKEKIRGTKSRNLGIYFLGE